MSHFWVPVGNASGEGVARDEWRVAPLEETAYGIDAAGAPSRAASSPAAPARVLSRAAGGAWVLFASDDVRVNAEAVVCGMRVLRDRDEVRVGAHRSFYSDEELPRVVAFSAAEHPPVDCVRCRQPLRAGDLAVRCPCLVWYHQSADLPCYEYTDRCGVCGGRTALDAGFRWSPEGL
jgi:hypothetical protein